MCQSFQNIKFHNKPYYKYIRKKLKKYYKHSKKGILLKLWGMLSSLSNERLCDKMKKKYVLMLLGVCVTAFLGGLTAGFLTVGKSDKEDKQLDPPAVEVKAKEEQIAKKEIDCYRVQAGEGYIAVYTVYSDNTKEEVVRSEMNVKVLPAKDVEMLKAGINLPEKTQALMLMENFVS